MRALLKSRLVLAILAVALLLGAYAAVCAYVLPGVAREQAQRFVRTHYARELSIGEIRIHPFALQVEVRGLALPDADGQPMLGCDRLFVDLELASLWNRTLTLALVSVEAPSVRAVLRPDGALNLADLALPASEPAATPADKPLPRLWVHKLQVLQGKAAFVDQASRTPFEEQLQNVAFELADFRTTPEGGNFRLSARSTDGASFEWAGHVALAPVAASTGTFKLGAVQLPPLLALLGDAVPFGLSAGTLHLEGSYSATLGAQTQFDLRLPTVQLRELGLRARGAQQPWVTIPEVAATGFTLAMPARAVAIERIGVQDAKAQLWVNPDRSVNLQALFTQPAGQAAAAAPATAAVAGSTPAPWTLKLGEFEVVNAAVDAEDRAIAPGTRFSVAPIRLRVANASLDLQQALPVALQAVVNQGARVEVQGTVTPAPLAASLSVRLARARLAVLQPYVLPHAALTITAGELDAAGQLELAPGHGGAPGLRFTGDIGVEGFKSISNDSKRDFVHLGKLQVGRLRYASAPAALQIERIDVRDPYALLTISPQREFNVTAVLNPQKATPAPAAAAGEPARAVASAAPPVPGVARPAEPFPVRVGQVRIDRMRLDFRDNFIQPNFSADVQQLSGTVTGLSSAPDTRAKVDLQGRVGEFSPVSIQGEVQAFAFDRYTDMRLRFESISLPILNPYSGPFAGYNIDKGQLTTDLHYRIENRRLAAEHKVRIDQLEWGDATPSQGQATLPVRFATALLKDRNGVINLDIPVGGTLDDPTFRLAPLVWQIIGNLITKAVTAPFALLGGASQAAGEAQFVDFAPGDAALPADMASHLAALGRSLADKPGLKLNVPIGAVAELDAPVLAGRAFEAALAAEVAARAGAKSGPGAYAQLPAAAKIEVLAALIQSTTGQPPQLPGGNAPSPAASVSLLEAQARAAMQVSDTELGALATQRALAVERFLLSGTGLDASRVFKVRGGNVSSQAGRVRFELTLQ